MIKSFLLPLAASVAFALPMVSANAGHHESKQEAKASADIVDTAVAAGSFNTLVAAVKAAGLVETLKGEGPFTVFAPTDEAFAKLPAGTVENLLKPENKAALVKVLTYHVVSGAVYAKDISGKTLNTASVEGGTLSIDGLDGVRVETAQVVKADIATSNGVIHVIDRVILPSDLNS